MPEVWTVDVGPLAKNVIENYQLALVAELKKVDRGNNHHFSLKPYVISFFALNVLLQSPHRIMRLSARHPRLRREDTDYNFSQTFGWRIVSQFRSETKTVTVDFVERIRDVTRQYDETLANLKISAGFIGPPSIAQL